LPSALRSIALFCGTSIAGDDVIDLQQALVEMMNAYLFTFAKAVGQRIFRESGTDHHPVPDSSIGSPGRPTRRLGLLIRRSGPEPLAPESRAECD
jgi:hypothetical protein